MVMLSAMQSGVTENLINELRMSLGVARQTLQRWRHWWREIFVGTPFWILGRGRFKPSIEHAVLPMSLLDRFQGAAGFPIAIGAVPAVSGTDFRDGGDHPL